MKAAVYNSYGGPEGIQIQDVPKPELKKGQVLVKVHAGSLNRIDSFIRNGYVKDKVPLQFPIVLGGDFAGIVSEIGEGVTDLKVGDKVYGNGGPFKGGSGALAEYVGANGENIYLKPTSANDIETAALPLAGTSAVQGIDEELKVQKGQKILIQGGAGGVGSLAIQIAKLRGAYVATTVSGEDTDYVKSIGADEVIDYKTQDVTEILKDYDGVFDLAGGDGTNKVLKVLKKGGILVTLAGQPDVDLAKSMGVIAKTQMTAVSHEHLKKVGEFVDAGKLKVKIEKVFTLKETKEAYTYFETKHPNGKIVVTVEE